LRPGLSDGTTDGSEDTEDSGDEDDTTTSEKTVERVRTPAANTGSTDIRSTILVRGATTTGG
jgi:hypothetical protein